MKLYFDTAYIAKCYWPEPDGEAIRELVGRSDGVYSSSLCIAEMACVFHRKLSEGWAPPADVVQRRDWFLADIGSSAITVIPMTEKLLYRTEALTRVLPPTCYLRAADAVHLVTAVDAGFTQIWTNDRHMLAAAPHFGLVGRSI